MTQVDNVRFEIAKAIYRSMGFSYEGRTVGANGPYGAWREAISHADSAILALEAAKAAPDGVVASEVESGEFGGAPAGYHPLSSGQVCKCFKLWTDGKGNHWCCLPIKTTPAPTPSQAAPSPAFDIVAHLERQRDFSLKTFGPGPRTKGVLDHIRKELAEIEADPADIMEWVDVIILAFDGAWRAGWEPDAIVNAIVAKQIKNEARDWPDWRTADPEKAIEHVREPAT